MVNAPYVDCNNIETTEFDENSILSFCCSDSRKCAKCGNLLFASSFVEKYFDSHPYYKIEWEKHIKADKHSYVNKLQGIFEQAIPDYQLLLQGFLSGEKSFIGILLSGVKGNDNGYYSPESNQIFIRYPSVITLFHESGHAIFHNNKEAFQGFNNTFKTESKNITTQKALKAFLEEKTCLGLKYDNCLASGYFNGKRSPQTDLTYWEWFEARLIAGDLFYEIIDIFGAITNKKYKAYCHYIGHGKSYFRRVLPSDEFFAEYFSLRAVNERLQLDILQSAFPNTCLEYERIINYLYHKYIGEKL